MDKALDFIRKAVSLQPDDGYILDSYGWAFYRMGQYDNAVKWMEQATGLIPDDATILDHLGDAYWQVGRHNEARFKWQRAEELSTDAAFRTTLEAKISHGVSPVQPAAAPHPAVPRAPGQKEAKL
jgi:Flp pilus assembly protein TadD